MVFRLLGWAINSTGLRENGIWLAGMDSGATSSQQTEYRSHSRAKRCCVIPANEIPFSHPITAGQTVHPATRRRPKRCLVDVGCTVWPACCRQRHSLARTPHPPHGIRRARDPSTPLAFARSARDDTWPPQAPQRSVLTRGPRRSGRAPKPAPLPSNPAGRGEPRVRAPSQQRPLVGGPPVGTGARRPAFP